MMAQACRALWRLLRWPLLVMLVFALPALISVAGHAVQRAEASNWWEARRDSAGLAPEPAEERGAVLQVYAARTIGWRGAFGVHTWIALKPADADYYSRYEVMGWGVRAGRPAIRRDAGPPDAYWFGSRPTLLVDLRGEAAADAIPQVLAAVERYPWPDRYRVWPGPNSNTFTAFVGRAVPALRLDLPPTAVGKDYLPDDAFVAPAPSGTGWQVSVYGLAGVLMAAEEGVELNLLGLSLGVDASPPALRLPGLGRIGYEPSSAARSRARPVN
jgi:hypothetical protein